MFSTMEYKVKAYYTDGAKFTYTTDSAPVIEALRNDLMRQTAVVRVKLFVDGELVKNDPKIG